MKNRTVKYLLFFAVAAAAAFGIYRYAVPDKYEYWNNLITQDPKPDGVSEKEYREKLRAGYCWRDRKFYTAEELQQKAMVSFSGRLLGEADAYWSDMTTNQGGKAYTSADCARSETACRVWFVPQDYTNGQWNKLFLTSEYTADKILKKYPLAEVKNPSDLQNYLTKYHNKGFSLIFRYAGKDGGNVYGSDCCKVLNKKAIEGKIKNKSKITYLEDGAIFPENDIPENIKIEDYGVGNFYFEVREIIPGLYRWDENKKRTYQSFSSEILFMNNCGDLLWQPFYVN